MAVKTPNRFSSQWARLEEVVSKKVADFLDQKKAGHYLFDWSLPLNAPELAAEFRIPDYFSHNYLKRTQPGEFSRIDLSLLNYRGGD